MSTASKIRLMLACLCASLLLTAIIVQQTYTPKNNLEQTAQILESNLHIKEALINQQFNEKPNFNRLKTLEGNGQYALKIIDDLTARQNIFVVTFKKGQLAFWSGVKVIPDHPELIKDGYSFINQPNGFYEAVKKTEGDFSAIFFIPVRLNYAFQNKYLKNTFSPFLLKDNNIDLADFTDKNIYPIHSINHSYLFSVKLKHNEVNHHFFYFELTLWALSLITLCIFVHSTCKYIVYKGYPGFAFILLAGFIILLRLVNLQYHWPNFTFTPEIFSSTLYYSGPLYPSFGDFCLNILFISWFVYFIYGNRYKIRLKITSRIISYCIILAGVLILISSSTFLLNLFYGLVLNSNISFDVNNVFNLSAYSLLGLLMLCFSFLIFYLLSEVFLTISEKLKTPASHPIIILLISIGLTTLIYSYFYGFTLFYILWALLVLVRAYAYKHYHTKLNPGSLVIIIFICALVASIKLNNFQAIKEKETRKSLIQKLVAPEDARINSAFKRIEKQIISDPLVIQYFNNATPNTIYFRNHFQKIYLDGSMPNFEITLHAFNAHGQPISSDKSYELSVFKEMVMYSSIKVSNYFYQDSGSFGVQNYFAIIPISENNKSLGTLIIELKSKSLQVSNAFPELLMDGSLKSADEFKNYSYALYSDGKLFSQSGNYIYNLVNKEFKGQVKKYAYATSHDIDASWSGNLITYNHLIYRPTERHLIVITKAENILLHGTTSLTFFFIIFLFFSAGVLLMRWFWSRMKILYIKDSFFHLGFKLNLDKVLYKTRIQFSMIFAVVVTLIIVGIITYLSISNQYQVQQDNMIRDKINRIKKVFENGDFTKDINNFNENRQNSVDEFAKTYAVDLTLFNRDGVELFTTQPKIYEFGLLARRLNAKAYTYLNKLQKSEFINREKIGDLDYKAAYVPLRNLKSETVAYLQLPYFSNEADYRERVGALLNAMINIYALVFIAIGLFAVIIARQITTPLNFIQYSLSKTIYGKKNAPIKWDRDDEIGALVKEYNKMIAALEDSAQKLAQSERESAWREMAKQVAHEIKNPLTPLKLGLQLLEKSWRDKDPKFDQKFERFSKSFVEQIESLSSIASEFSAFAKMPDTRMERTNIFEMLNQAVTIFKQMDNIKILFKQPDAPFFINADKDQLLRCFNNLLKNAIEATPADRFGIIEINFLITSKTILLSIKDNGNGINENMREKIFEPNFTTKSSGTGLGLAFVKNSIENAGGKVWFETIVGTGTTFYFSLPEAS